MCKKYWVHSTVIKGRGGGDPALVQNKIIAAKNLILILDRL